MWGTCFDALEIQNIGADVSLQEHGNEHFPAAFHVTYISVPELKKM